MFSNSLKVALSVLAVIVISTAKLIDLVFLKHKNIKCYDQKGRKHSNSKWDKALQSTLMRENHYQEAGYAQGIVTGSDLSRRYCVTTQLGTDWNSFTSH